MRSRLSLLLALALLPTIGYAESKPTIGLPSFIYAKPPKVSGMAHFRYVYNQRQHSGGDDQEYGFQLRRAKISAEGKVGLVRYATTLATGRKINEVALEDLYADFGLSDSLSLRVGRFKLPFLLEELVSSKRLLAAERATLTEFFTLNRSEGLMLTGDHDALRWYAAFSDGSNAGNIGGDALTSSNDFYADRTNFAVTARAELKLTGAWKQYANLGSESADPLAVFLAAAAHYEQGETGDAETPPIDLLAWTVDAVLERQGLHLMTLFAHHRSTPDQGPIENDYGAMAQAAYTFEDRWQPFARYEHFLLDSEDTVRLVTVGLNTLIDGEAVKLTIDGVYGLDPLSERLNNALHGADGTSGGLGLRPDAEDQEGQLALRAQLQLLF